MFVLVESRPSLGFPALLFSRVSCGVYRSVDIGFLLFLHGIADCIASLS